MTDEEIYSMTLLEYITWLNSKFSSFPLSTDLSFWAECGVTTAKDMAEYLDAEYAHNIKEDEWNRIPF